jgi:hypothetical protein
MELDFAKQHPEIWRKKLIHHVWDAVIPSKKLKHKKCSRCHCEKFWDQGFRRLIYIDRFGRMSYRTPSCVLPNTKLP